MGMTDAPATQKRNNDDLDRQAKARRIKQELIKENGLEKATEEYIDALYYYQIYFSTACWKNDPKIVASTELKKLTLETMKYSALKENIMIQVKGLSWEWCHHAWSKDGKYYVQELARHLRWIIK